MASLGYTNKYTGGDAELDAILKAKGEKYNTAKATGDTTGMQNANDQANQARNDFGYAAEYANEDIANVARQNAGTSAAYTSGSSSGTGESSHGSGVKDYSSYLEDLYAAQRQAALDQLQSAYEQNVGTLNQAEEKIPEEYQSARNSTAGASELAKRNFNEYAAASGLNSGAGGQAELARNVTLQNNLNTLNQQQASDLSDLELQRTQLEQEYNSSIAQAQADNNTQLAQALYQEKVRVNDAILSQMNQDQQNAYQQAALNLQQSQFDWQKGQQDWENQFNQQQYNDNLAQQNYQDLMGLTQQLAQYGDYSGYAALAPSQAKVLIEAASKSGVITEEQARTLLRQYGFQA